MATLARLNQPKAIPGQCVISSDNEKFGLKEGAFRCVKLRGAGAIRSGSLGGALFSAWRVPENNVSRVPLFGTTGGRYGTHPRPVDKVLGIIIKRAATAPVGAMDVERVLVR